MVPRCFRRSARRCLLPQRPDPDMKVIVIASGYAGVACATRLAHSAARRQQAIQITLVNPVDAFIERIRLH